MRILGIDPGYAILGWGVVDVEGNRFKAVAYDSILTDSLGDGPGDGGPDHMTMPFGGDVAIKDS